jgi:large subunit ribosomal protein L22
MDEVRAQLKYLRIAPKKVRRLASLLRGMSYPAALAQLKYWPERSARPLYKLLLSAGANAKHNARLEPESLLIKRLLVDPGPSHKRMMERAHGAGFPILKRTSHLTIVLGARAGKITKAVVAEVKDSLKDKTGRELTKTRSARQFRSRSEQKQKAVGAARRERVFQRKAI